MIKAPFAAVEADLAEQTMGLLANVVVVRGDGLEFAAELDTADEISFDHITAGSHVLTYLSANVLSDGERVVIGGRAYKVAAPPRRRGAHLFVADMVAL